MNNPIKVAPNPLSPKSHHFPIGNTNEHRTVMRVVVDKPNNASPNPKPIQWNLAFVTSTYTLRQTTISAVTPAAEMTSNVLKREQNIPTDHPNNPVKAAKSVILSGNILEQK